MHTFLTKLKLRLSADKNFFEILHGTAWAMASRVGTTVFALISSLMITRMYGAESMGILAIVTSILSIASIFSVLGTNTAILRLIPEHITKYSPTSAFRVYRKAQYLVAGASLVCSLLLFGFSRQIASDIFNKPHLSGIVAICAAFVLFRSTMLLNQQAARGLKLIRFYSILQLLPHLLLCLMLAIAIPWSQQYLPSYMQLSAWTMTSVLGFIIMHVAFSRRIQKDDKLSAMSYGAILSLAAPMLMSASMNIVISETSIIVLGMFCPTTEVGYYAVAVRLASLTTFILSAVNTMSAPTFSQLYHQGNTKELCRIALKSTRLIFWTTFPILIALVVLGNFILYIFKPEFTKAYPALIILVLGQFVNSISGSTGLLMNMTGHQKHLLILMTCAAILNIVTNAVLTPVMGIIGAAIASALSMCCWNVLALRFIYKRFGYNIGYIPWISRLNKRAT
jgi:O-antigen/teichoic acid export membrane protein